MHTTGTHMNAHVHIRQNKTKFNSVEKILSINTSNIRHRKEKLICGYVLKKNGLLLKHRECSISQSFHDCKARVQRRRKKVMSEAPKFVFPSSNVSAP